MQVSTPDPLRNRRRGAVFVESAIVSSVVLLLLLTGFNLTLATLRYNALGEAARRATRAAIVRGETNDEEIWGVDSVTINAADGSPLGETVRSALVAMNPAEVQITAEWLDGTNEIGANVRVQVTYEHQLLMPGASGLLPLTGTSVMQIVH